MLMLILVGTLLFCILILISLIMYVTFRVPKTKKNNHYDSELEKNYIKINEQTRIIRQLKARLFLAKLFKGKM